MSPATQWATEDGRYWARRAHGERFTRTTSWATSPGSSSTNDDHEEES